YLDSPPGNVKWRLNSSDKIISLRRQHVQDFVSHFADLRKASTVNLYVTILNNAFDGAKKDQVITNNPVEFVDKVKKDRDDNSPTRRPFTIPELQAILAAAPDKEWRSMI